MLDYPSLIPFVNNGLQNIKLFGDKSQIGFVDFSTTSGRSFNKNLFDYIP